MLDRQCSTLFCSYAIGALNGVTVGRVGGHIIEKKMLPDSSTPVLHNSKSKLLENWAWARNSRLQRDAGVAEVARAPGPGQRRPRDSGWWCGSCHKDNPGISLIGSTTKINQGYL